MKRLTTLAVLVLCAALALPANAQLLGGGLLGGLLGTTTQVQSRVIVRDQLGGSVLELTCWLLGCQVQAAIDSGVPGGSQVFLVTTYNSVTSLLTNLLALPGVVDAEPDVLLNQPQPAPLTNVSGLWDRTTGNYYGTVVWHGYADQAAVWQIGLPTAQLLWHDSGAGIVAVIGTGVDSTQPVLQKVLLPGYDFTANNSTSGTTDQYAMAVVNQWAMAVVNNEYPPVVVNQWAMAVVNGEGANTLSQSQYGDFGHGTMVAGIIHLVAPSAKILPLTAFQADGSGYLSAVLRAIYYAVQNHATVINMSFDFPSASPELQDAVAYATQHGVTCVASAGNDGQDVMVYPAGYQDDVMGIASVDNVDQRSSFSNYGDGLVFAAAPGEAVITTYPGNTYAAGWGTSFSAPFVSGAVALLDGMQTGVTPGQAMQILGQSSTFTAPDLGHGVLNVANALALLSQERNYGGN